MSYDPLDRRSPEDEFFVRLDLDALIARLPLDEQYVVRGTLEGRTPEQLGATEFTFRRLVHKMATLAGAMTQCTICKVERSAHNYGWNEWTGKQRCFTCEDEFSRWRRNTVDRAEGEAQLA